MPRLRWLPSAKTDLLGIHRYIARESGSATVADRFVALLRAKCASLAKLKATMGVARPELRPDVRSFPFKGYVIFFRYREDFLEVVDVLEGHRDFVGFFSGEPRRGESEH
jgi:plasmid stabilization system protein ParE